MSETVVVCSVVCSVVCRVVLAAAEGWVVAVVAAVVVASAGVVISAVKSIDLHVMRFQQCSICMVIYAKLFGFSKY